MGWVLSKRAEHSEHEREPKLPPSLPNQWRHMECFGCHAGHAWSRLLQWPTAAGGTHKNAHVAKPRMSPQRLSSASSDPSAMLSRRFFLNGWLTIIWSNFVSFLRPCKNRPAPKHLVGMKRCNWCQDAMAQQFASMRLKSAPLLG